MSDIFHKASMEDAACVNGSGKNDLKRRLFTYGAGAAILLIVAISVSGFVSPVMAKALQKTPFIDSITNIPKLNQYASEANPSATDKGITLSVPKAYYDGELQRAPFSDIFTNIPKLNQYASEANPSVTDKGITVSVPKAYYDGNQVILLYDIDVPEGYEPVDGSQVNLTVTKILLSDKPLPFNSATGRDSLVSPNTYHGNIVWYLSSKVFDQVPRSGLLTLPIHQVGTIKGDWTLSVPVSSEAIDNAVETFYPKDVSKTYDGITITVNKVRKGPVHTTISMQVRQPLQMKSRLPIYMPLNGMIFTVYTPSHKPPIDPAEFIAINPSKKVGNDEVWDDLTVRCFTPPDDVKSIIIEPVLAIMYEEGVTEGYCPNIPQLAITVPLN